MQRKFFLLFILQFTSFLSYGQRLSIEETVEYINNVLHEDLVKFSSTTSYHLKLSPITISSDGVITKGENHFKFYFDDVRIEKVYYSGSSFLYFYCKNHDKYSMDEPNCITIRSLSLDSRKPTQYENSVSKICNLRAWDSYSIDRLYNAFQYLFITMKESSKFNRGGDDPFAQTIYDKIENQIESKSSNEVIPLLSNNGVYEIWVKLGAIKKKFVLDSGASDITISNEVEKELINLGVIKKENYSSPALYRIADGSIISCRRITLPSLTVGKFTIKNVTVSVSNSMLLGKGFLDKFSRWTINNNSKSLELER